MISSFQDAMSAVMSLTRPASTCWRRPPPPHVWNRSGTSPCCMQRGQLGLERLVLVDLDVDLDVRVGRHVLVGQGLPQAEARIVVLDVIPGDGDRLGGLRRLSRRGRRGSRRRCGRRRGRGAAGTRAEHEHRCRRQRGDPSSGHRHQSSLLHIAWYGWLRDLPAVGPRSRSCRAGAGLPGGRRASDGRQTGWGDPRSIRSSGRAPPTVPKVARTWPHVSVRSLYDCAMKGVNPRRFVHGRTRSGGTETFGDRLLHCAA